MGTVTTVDSLLVLKESKPTSTGGDVNAIEDSPEDNILSVASDSHKEKQQNDEETQKDDERKKLLLQQNILP